MPRLRVPKSRLSQMPPSPWRWFCMELATNVTKYWALSNGHGRVSIRWRKASRGRSNGSLVLDSLAKAPAACWKFLPNGSNPG